MAMPKKGTAEQGKRLMPPSVRVVADNLKALMAYHRRLAAEGHKEAEPRLGHLLGLEDYIREQQWFDTPAVGKSTLGRMRKGDNPVGLDVVEVVARAYGLQAWHLLIPGLDPRNPPYYRVTSIEHELEQALQNVAARYGKAGTEPQTPDGDHHREGPAREPTRPGTAKAPR